MKEETRGGVDEVLLFGEMGIIALLSLFSL